MFSYPLQVHPCRNCLDKIFHLENGAAKSALTDNDDGDGDNDDDFSAVDEHGTGGMSVFKHTLLTAAITASGFMTAYFVDDLQTGEPLHAVMDSAGANSTMRQFFRSLVQPGRRRFRSFYLVCSSGN